LIENPILNKFQNEYIFTVSGSVPEPPLHWLLLLQLISLSKQPGSLKHFSCIPQDILIGRLQSHKLPEVIE